MSNNGRETNKLLSDDRAVHDWYRFVLSFPPHLVRDYLERLSVAQGDVVLDPFCGTGTTVVECKKLGVDTIGVEANPMSLFASQVKVSWSADPDKLMRHAGEVVSKAEEILRADGLENLQDLPLLASRPIQNMNLRTLPLDMEKLLLRNSISALPLHRVLVLREVLEESKVPEFYPYERLALAKTIVGTASNLHFGPEVGVKALKTDAPVIDGWLDSVSRTAEDLRSWKEKLSTARVEHADARDIGAVLPKASIDAVITSPPYPNEKDYTRTTRLESVILGLISSKQELRSFKKTLVRSNTRTVYKDDDDDALVSDNAEVQRIAEEIEKRRISMGKTSGWERQYHRVTKLYFGGMARHLADLRHALRPGARLAYVVGDQASYLRVMIRTGQILADIASSLGYFVEDIDLFRTRRATATRAELREEVVILRWPGAA